MFLKKQYKKYFHNDEGYTLLELIIVLAILALIMGLAAPMVMKQFSKAKSETASLQVKALKANMEFLFLDMGRYPTQAEGLSLLYENKTAVTGWNGPYVSDAESLLDPWGRPYIYTIGEEGGRPFTIKSLGADGEEGGTGENEDVSTAN